RTLRPTFAKDIAKATVELVLPSPGRVEVGRSVLIIDADMRKPSFVADAGSSIGLSGMLTRDAVLSEQVVRSGTDNLYLLPAGIIPPNPAELLSSPKLRSVLQEAKDAFDLVVIDSPPVLSFTDAPLLGSIAEGSVIVVQAGSIRTPAVQRTISRMLDSRTNVLGILLTKFDAKKTGAAYSYYGYAYGKNAYSYSEKNVSDSSERRRKIRIFSETDSGTEHSEQDA
ncbi:MAG: CpsD/CapB family tyrosine-protein kinase, partial [Pseudomonadota bacterium]